MRILLSIVSLIFLNLMIIHCSVNEQDKAIINEIEKWQQDRATNMISDPNSPMAEQDRTDKKKLKFYDADLKFRFPNSFTPYQQAKIVNLNNLQSKPIKHYALGSFRFKVDDKECILEAYFNDDKSLWTAFFDNTNNDTTYGGGRYLEIKQSPQGNFILDFNYSFNPHCAYNDNYICTVPPLCNKFDVEIKAGEKIFKEHK